MTVSISDMIMLIMLTTTTVLLIVLLVRQSAMQKKLSQEELSDLLQRLESDMEELRHDINETIPSRVGDIRIEIDRRLRQDADENRQNRIEINSSLERSSIRQDEALDRFREKLNDTLKESLSELSSSNREALSELSRSNKEKLSEIQTEINQKLDSSLNERLDASFKTVGEQLNRLYTSLGELSRLEDGVTNLNRTLSNVKTRGIYGETQLENILADILPPNLYDKNVVTKQTSGNRDAVEFAIRIPDKEVAGDFLYLPIDSKFPASIYDRIRDAAEKGDAAELSRSTKELEQFIKGEARSIEEKYIDPPHTTDFAIMFLPTESLYAEVLRIPGLSEDCQKRHHIVITGPSTVTALLNSLSIGFRYMAVNRDSKNILKLLSAIKTQYAKLSELISKADSRIESAKNATSELQRRADLINKKLSQVEELDPMEAKKLLGLTEDGQSDQD